MAKREKRIVKTPMVAHLWAHKSQSEASNPYRNFYFYEDTIYSYGSHFPIATHITHKGKNAVLLTTRIYSVTTSGHRNCVADACRHLTVFRVKHPTSENRREQFEEYRERFAIFAGMYTRARVNKSIYFTYMRDAVEEANAFAKFFGLRCRLKMPKDLAKMEEECRKIDARKHEVKKQTDEIALKAAMERVEKWVNGEDTLYGYSQLAPIRLRIKGNALQTSRGAEVPLEHAIKAFRIIKRLRDKGEAYQRNGHTIHLGHFAIDSIDSNGNVKAGCHEIEWSEIERVAKLAGVG